MGKKYHLEIKCTCGRHEKLEEAETDFLKWNEDESLQCECGISIPYKTHDELGDCGVSVCR